MPEDLRAIQAWLPGLLLLSFPMVVLLWVLHRDALRIARFRRPQGPREPALWGASEVILGFCAWFFSEMGAHIVFAGPVADGKVSYFVMQLLSSITSTSVLYVFVLQLVRGLLGQPLATLGLVKAPIGNVAPVVACFVLFYLPLNLVTHLWILGLYHAFGVEPVAQQAVDLFRAAAGSHSALEISSIMFVGIVLAPMAEELLFRGLIHGWLRARWGARAGAIGSALLFACVHLSLTALAPLFVTGLVLSHVYERTGSLYFSMLFHAIFNAVAFVAMLLVQSA